MQDGFGLVTASLIVGLLLVVLVAFPLMRAFVTAGSW